MKSVRKISFPAFLSTFVLCAAFWIVLTWPFTADGVIVQEIVGGALVSAAVALFSCRFLIHEKAFWLWNPAKFFTLLFYCIVIFPWELLKANWDVAKRALSPKLPIHPGIVKVPVKMKSDYGRAMLADSITLTPGTITMDIEDTGDGAWYYIHWIDVTETDPQKAGDIIKGTLEKWVGRIWK